MMKAGTVRLNPVRRTFFLVLICAIVSTGFIGYCRSYAASPPSKQSGRVITDLVGNKVAIQKTASLLGFSYQRGERIYQKTALHGKSDFPFL
jgi:hypothetical protein